jgi:hypothetical protein
MRRALRELASTAPSLSRLGCALLLLLSGGPALAQDAESLAYSVNWSSGLSVGEARLESKKTASDRRELLFTLEASIPGFEVVDRYRSLATAALCSVEFEKDSRHGKRVTHELTAFDQQGSTATRQTPGGGGSSRIDTSACAKDALAFLEYLRREVAAGRLPPAQTVYFGGPYQIRLESAGQQWLELGGEAMDVDRITASVKGKTSDVTFEIFLARDSSRRPVLVRLPLPPGTFSMELVP